MVSPPPPFNRGNLDLVVTPLHFTVWKYVG